MSMKAPVKDDHDEKYFVRQRIFTKMPRSRFKPTSEDQR